MNSMPLTFFLTKPFQRVMKYPVLLKRVVDTAPKTYSGKKELKEAYEEISVSFPSSFSFFGGPSVQPPAEPFPSCPFNEKTVVKSLNEEKRTRENHEKMLQLSTKIKGDKGFDLLDNGKRIYVRDAKVSEIEFTDYIHQKTLGDITLFLFEDALMVTRKAQFFDEYKVKSQDIYPLSNVTIKVDTIPPDSEGIC